MRLLWDYSWRTIVIGILSFVALLIAGSLISVYRLPMPEVNGDTNYILVMTVVSGATISVFLGIISKHLRLSRLSTFGVVFTFLFLNYVTQIMEALYFVPGIVSWEVLPSILLQQFLMALIISTGVILLYKSKRSFKSKPIWYLSLKSFLYRILICITSYVIFYYLFGMINAFLFTESYYLSQIDGLNLPGARTIFVLEIMRGMLIVISILPIILSLDLPVNKIILLSGLSLFILGGLLPMLQQIGSLPIVIIISSSVEMFFQFFLTVVVTTVTMYHGKKKELVNGTN